MQRLIEAKAAVDAEANDGRGLGRRILGRENPPEAMGSSRDEVDEMLICCGNCYVSMVYQDNHVALFVFATGSFPTPRCAAEKYCKTLELDFFLSKISACQFIARPSQSKNCSFSLEGFHSNDSNVTFAFLQVS